MLLSWLSVYQKLANLLKIWRRSDKNKLGHFLAYPLQSDHTCKTDINFEQFKRQLKTFLFGRWERGALWLLLNCAF